MNIREAVEQRLQGADLHDVLLQCFKQELGNLGESNWIQKAVQNPGALSRKLGVPNEETIPDAMLDLAYARAKRDHDPQTMRQINLARRFKTMAKNRKK
jgi:hypothetical protein